MVRGFDQLELIAAFEGDDEIARLLWRFPVQKEYMNHYGTLSGGAQASSHDSCTGCTLLAIAKPGYWSALGSSRTLNMSHFAPAHEGDVLQMETKVCAQPDSIMTALT